MLPASERSDCGKSRENLGLLDIYRQCELNLSAWFAEAFSRSVPIKVRTPPACKGQRASQLGNDIDAPYTRLARLRINEAVRKG